MDEIDKIITQLNDSMMDWHGNLDTLKYRLTLIRELKTYGENETTSPYLAEFEGLRDRVEAEIKRQEEKFERDRKRITRLREQIKLVKGDIHKHKQAIELAAKIKWHYDAFGYPLTDEQVSQWIDFSSRMAKACYADSQHPPADWIVQEVESVLECLKSQGDMNLIISWDKSAPYPIGSGSEGYDYYGLLKDPGKLCDIFKELVEDQMWDSPYDYATEAQAAELDRLDQLGEDGYDAYDELKEEIVEEWTSPVHCCIRAGLDIAGVPTAGVLGFDLGDLRKMYPEGLPDWLCSQFTEVDLKTLPDSTPILL